MHRCLMAAVVTALLVSAGCKATQLLQSEEDQLAGHLDQMTKIITDGKDTPATALTSLRSYMHENLPQMAQKATALMMELDTIDDGAKRAERLKEIMTTIDAAAAKFMDAAPAFGMAAAMNEDAQKTMKAIMDSYAATEKAMGDFGDDLKSMKTGGNALMDLL